MCQQIDRLGSGSQLSETKSVSFSLARVMMQKTRMPVSYFTARNSYYGDRACSVVQSCPALCDPMGYSPPGTTVHGIFQARILSGLPFPTPGDLPDAGIKPASPVVLYHSATREPPTDLILAQRLCPQIQSYTKVLGVGDSTRESDKTVWGGGHHNSAHSG